MPDETEGLEINQDLRFQRREWRVQRIGWWGLSTFVVAAILGLFGGGPLSRAQAGESAAPLWIEYERFVRVGAPTRVVVHHRLVASGPQGHVQLHINRAYFDAFRIGKVLPEPEGVDIGPSEVVLRFAPRVVETPVFTVILDVEPLRVGRRAAELRAGGGAMTFTQFAYF